MTRKQKKLLCRILGAAALLLSAFLVDRLLAGGWPVAAVMCLYLPAYFLAGYDVLRGQDDSIPACIVRADKKLYQDKARGRQTEPAAQKE